MAARPGEENVATLYGDVHYFYSPPTTKPPHHRFDKGSYIYLFEDANQGRARLEIANNPGTEDQDAFTGYLDKIHLRYSYRHICLVTLTVGEVEGTQEWHLPTWDPHNQAKYHYKLHSLDIYFWTPQDALMFVNGIRRVLPAAQCEVLDEPGPPPREEPEVSAVVQRLEQAAISESQAESSNIDSNESTEQPAPSFSGAPVSAVAGATGIPAPAALPSLPPPPPPPAPQQFAPIAYNPAAPPAPEQVVHREKTPPPDDGSLNPLQQTLVNDAATPFSPGLPPGGPSVSPISPTVPPPTFQLPPGAPTFPGPPQRSVTSPGFAPQGFGSLNVPSTSTIGATPVPTAAPVPTPVASAPLPQPGITRATTMPVQGVASPLASPSYPNTGIIGSGLATPGLPNPYAPVSYPGYMQPNPAATHAPTPPVAGVSVAPPPATQPMDYSVHQQFYVPENHVKPTQEPKGKLEAGAAKLDRALMGIMKKVEKKFG